MRATVEQRGWMMRWSLRAMARVLGLVGLGVSACTPTGGPGTLAGLDHQVVNTVDGGGRGTLSVDGCMLLDTSSVFTQRIDGLPAETFAAGADPIERARTMLDAVGRNELRSGASAAPGFDGLISAMQLNTVASSQRSVLVGTSVTGVGSANVLLPGDDNAVRWENMYASGGEILDRHLHVLGTSPCRLQEHIRFSLPFLTTESSVEWNLPIRAGSDTLLVVGGTPVSVDVDGARLPITPLVYRYDEVVEDAAPISHALRMVVPVDVISTDHVWPAGKSDGSATDPAALPMGARLRLKASTLGALSSTATPESLKILTALHHYGAVVADSNGATSDPGLNGRWSLNGDYNPRWPAGVTDGFPALGMEDFEIVDTSCWERGDGDRLAVVDGTLPSSC